MHWRNLPKRWSRAKRKRIRVGLILAYYREQFRKTYREYLDKTWGDAMQPFDWASALDGTVLGQVTDVAYVDDV